MFFMLILVILFLAIDIYNKILYVYSIRLIKEIALCQKNKNLIIKISAIQNVI